MTNVPLASDGSFFSPHLLHNGKFRVGDKGNEKEFANFDEALAYLKAQPVARWRRPNPKGNWGIVTAVGWGDRELGAVPGEIPGEGHRSPVKLAEVDNCPEDSIQHYSSPPKDFDAGLGSATSSANGQIASDKGGSSASRPDVASPVSCGLPPHGRISCAACFRSPTVWGHTSQEDEGWLLENNPCSWGASDPRFLVLGFSKGMRQTEGLLQRPFDHIPFAGFRPKLTEALRLLCLLSPDEKADDHIRADEMDWGFGSVVRCSVAKINPLAGKPEKSGAVISESARRRSGDDWIGQCMSRWLGVLPPRLEVVILLSNDDDYVDACYERVHRLHPATRRINDVAYGDGRVTWVHIVHVGGPGINHIDDWLAGADNKQGRKRALALEAVRSRTSMR